MSELVKFNTYTANGTNTSLKAGTSLIKYGCSFPDQGAHSEICDGYISGRTSLEHNMDYNLYGRCHIILFDITENKLTDLINGSETIDTELELNPLHNYSIIMDGYGGTTTVTCPRCGYGKSFQGNYSMYVESWGTYEAYIKKQPTNVTKYANESATYSINTINVINYQWKLYKNNNWISLSDGAFGDGIEIAGSTTSKIIISNLKDTLDNTKVKCTVTGADFETKDSDEATLRVIDVEGPNITITKSTEELTTNPVILTITVTDPNPDLPENPYSFDGGLTYGSSSSYTVNQNSIISIAVKDRSNNITRRDVTIDNIIKQLTNPKKRITVEDLSYFYENIKNNEFGTKVNATVSGASLSFTNSNITSNSIIDGPYIADVLVGLKTVSQSGTTITYTLSNSSANGKNAYIYIRE